MKPLSKSQIEAFNTCQRKWGWAYLDGIRKTNRSAELGLAIHKDLEEYFQNGIFPESKLAQASLHHWPAPGPHISVEAHLETESNGIDYHGFRDIGFREPRHYVVGDHKSTSDLKWALKPAELAEDLQANIYAKATCEEEGVEEVELRWVYTQTRGEIKAHRVVALRTLQDATRYLAERVDPVSEKIIEAYETRPAVLDMPPTYESCSKYGGCAYAENCGLGLKEEKVNGMSLAEKLRAKAESRAVEGPPKVETQTRTLVAETTPEMFSTATEEDPINPPEAKRKRGRPPKDKTLLERQLEASVKETQVDLAPTTVVMSQAEVKRVIDEASPEGFTLCVGCYPTKIDGQVIAASDIIETAKRLVARDFALDDYRFAEFGKGPGLLAVALRAALNAAKIPDGSYVYLDARTEEARHTIETFRSYASREVRAL